MKEISKQEYYTGIINSMLNQELSDIKKVTKNIEEILKADLIDIDSKVIRVFEEMQKIRFNSQIFRNLQIMKQD